MATQNPVSARRRNGVQSIEVGADLLRALAAADEPQSLGSLARAAGMTSGKAHRYLVSYVQSGLVIQSERSGTYDLGPLAVRVGLAALHRYDAVKVAAARLGDLRDAVGETVTLSVWAEGGPTVARIELGMRPVTLAVRVGTTYPIVNTATGQVFLAFHDDRSALQSLVENDLAALRKAEVPNVPHDAAAVDELTQEVRARRLASVDQSFLVGISAMAGPVFGGDGRLAAVVTVIGPSQGLDLRWEGPVATALRAFTISCSDQSKT